MPRNAGSTVDAAARTVRARDGVTYPLDDVVVAGDLVYLARPGTSEAFWYMERWTIPSQSWVVNRFAFNPHRTDAVDWYIEPDVIERDGDLWRITDAFIDVDVYEGQRYHVDDADELGDALASGEITPAEAAAALRALDRLCDELRDNGCSGAALLRRHAPALPTPRVVRGADGIFALTPPLTT
jgi:predicted RNA-binding protein associated with RNAse of E/G family